MTIGQLAFTPLQVIILSFMVPKKVNCQLTNGSVELVEASRAYGEPYGTPERSRCPEHFVEFKPPDTNEWTS
ncbi:hypothetical protein RHS04_09327 [Rhizoctonia solani]|uniref:Uncharacterized protein n=1 Tax=Rhizoctonia solani TaxID=456999 RepID=A0A8H7LDA6_9AGAM|nr:hypothetical protein RHS04_09327 [Rhizoctonia solani]